MAWRKNDASRETEEKWEQKNEEEGKAEAVAIVTCAVRTRHNQC